jgi:hypothetical protein
MENGDKLGMVTAWHWVNPTCLKISGVKEDVGSFIELNWIK